MYIKISVKKNIQFLTTNHTRSKWERMIRTIQIVRNLQTIPFDRETIEIINNTRGGIVIYFTDNKRERVYWEANSSPGCRARR